MNKVTYEQELEKNGTLIYTTVGRSMRPFLRSQEDLVMIEAKKDARFRKYDVVLYRRHNGKYVLHRIVKVYSDSYTICGDNCWQLERGISDDQILGVLTAVVRNGKRIDVNSRSYRLCVRLWCALYGPRAAILYLRGLLYSLWRKLKTGIRSS